MHPNHTRWVFPIAFTLTMLATACGLPESSPVGIEPLADAAVADTDAGRLDAFAVADGAEEPVHDDLEDAPSPDPSPPLEAHLEVTTTAYTVRRGESLAHFARWAEVPVELIAELSALDLLEPLAVGEEVRVPADWDTRGVVESRRTAHHHRRAEGYLESRGGSVGTDFYRVQTGDSAWTIAQNQLGIPVWLLETYNPAVDLEQLRPGQELMVPVVADIVVELDPIVQTDEPTFFTEPTLITD